MENGGGLQEKLLDLVHMLILHWFIRHFEWSVKIKQEEIKNNTSKPLGKVAVLGDFFPSEPFDWLSDKTAPLGSPEVEVDMIWF